MNVLVVDDQIPVVEGLVNHIHWDKLEVGRVFSACCWRMQKDHPG